MSNFAPQIQREMLDEKRVRVAAGDCEFMFTRLRPGALLIAIKGNDRGQFGAATIDEAAREFSRTRDSVRLFIDTTHAHGPTREVMESWTEWFAANKQRLERVAILVNPDSQLLHLTVSIVKHLSGTGNLIRMFSEADEFDAAVRQIAPDYQPPGRALR